MNKAKIKILAGILAFSAAITSAAGCGSGTNTPAQPADTAAPTAAAETPAASDTEQTQNSAASLSNPVAMTADGDVDMTVALAYETDFDALMKQLDAKTVAADHPVSENTNEKTLALYQWLRSIYGKQVISAQQVGNAYDKDSIAYYYYTDDLPAMKGFDFIFKTTPGGDTDDWTQMAIDWHTKSGGLVTFCWHWNVPIDVDEPDGGHAFYSEQIKNFSLANAVTPGTKEYEIAVHDIDLIAYELQKLESAGVPVLWRPLHEASGKWFWWGMADKETVEKEYYQKLWYMIYDRLENYHKLTNLIWVWNGQNKHMTVHKNTYDISGIDVYPNSEDHSVLQTSYNNLAKITDEGKMLTLSECGYIPDPDELAANMSTVKWLYYMPWNSLGDGGFIYKGNTVLGIPLINEEKMSLDFFKKSMASETVITWNELPTFEGTEHELPERIKMAAYDMQLQKEKDAENK
ncbi:MAG: beta-mannanase [Ruminiclostridium sp.]|nr:beta-mannanase [Ruminiclostridium sp.]